MIPIDFVITSLSTGGAELMLERLVERLGKEFVPRVICLGGEADVGSRMSGRGIEVAYLNLRGPGTAVLGLAKLARMFRARRPRVVSTWLYHADLVGGLAARLALRGGVVWNVRNLDLSRDKTKWGTRTVVSVCAKLSGWIPERIISCSEDAARVHCGRGYRPDAFEVIPNGFDLQRFRPDPEARVSVRRELGLSDGAELVGMIARFDPLKNHRGFLQAAARLAQSRNNAHFVLVGPGVTSANPEIAAWNREAGHLDRIHLLGSRDDVPRIAAALDVAASASWGEAFPNAVGEAMACGVPCVVTNAGDSAYIVGDAGIVVERGDMAALARGLDRVLALPEEERRALGRRARKQIEERFEIGVVVRKYEDLFRQVATPCSAEC